MKLVKGNFQFLALEGAKIALNARTPLINVEKDIGRENPDKQNDCSQEV